MLKWKRLKFVIPSVALVSAIVAGIFIVPSMTAKAETYNESNPEFLEARINSDVELQYGEKNAYEQTTEFKQSADSGKYEITTDAYVVWYHTDDVAFLYRQYNIGDAKEDKLVIEATVESQESTTGAGLYTTASSGIMLRGSAEDPAAASLYLHTRSSGVDVVYRMEEEGLTYHVSSNITPVYPVTLRVEKIGQKYACSFKNGNSDSYIPVATLGCKMGGPIYAGLASHCSKKNAPIHSYYSNYTAVGSGSLEVSDSNTGGPKEPEKLEHEDPPYNPETMLLYETFSDGSMVSGKEEINNPIWNEEWGEIVMNEEKTNRQWYISFEDNVAFAGSETKWTDYSVSLDYEICPGVSTASDERLILWVRHKGIEPYGYYGLGFAIETISSTDSNGELVTIPYLNVYHRQRVDIKTIGTKVAGVKIDEMIGSGVHKLRVDCFDRTFTAYLDGKEILSYVDSSTSPNLRGCIGIEAQEIEAYIDNIVVTKLEDPNGGDYDNYIGANYDDDIPDYVKEFMEKYEIDY